MGIKLKWRSNDDKAASYCVHVRERLRNFNFDKYGIQGVNALRSLTPVDTGKTSDSWSYKIERSLGKVKISFYNSNTQNGVNVAILLQYGHATKSGAWVQGIDFINPAMEKVFEELAKDLWSEVTRT